MDLVDCIKINKREEMTKSCQRRVYLQISCSRECWTLLCVTHYDKLVYSWGKSCNKKSNIIKLHIKIKKMTMTMTMTLSLSLSLSMSLNISLSMRIYIFLYIGKVFIKILDSWTTGRKLNHDKQHSTIVIAIQCHSPALHQYITIYVLM